MRKIIVLCVVFLVFGKSFGQDLVSESKIDFDKKSFVYQIMDNDKKELNLLIDKDQTIGMYKFDSTLKVVDSIFTVKPNEVYQSIAGHASSNSKYKVFWISSNDKKLYTQSYDFKAKTVFDEAINLEYEKEKVIKKITINNIFYIISALKNTSILKFYIFSAEGKYEVKKVDLSSLKFYSSSNFPVNLYNLFYVENFQYISDEVPISLTLASERRKLYVNGNSVIFACDNNVKETQILKINLSDYSFEQKIIYYNSFDRDFVKSNSFLVNDKLLQLQASSEKVVLTFKDLNSENTKSFEAVPDQEITFKNSEVIQENGSIKDKKVLEKSNQFLRKLSSSDLAVSCFIKDGNYIATIGSVGEVQSNNGGAAAMAGMFGIAGALMYYALAPNTYLENLNSYRNRRVVYLYSSFDKDFNHNEGQIQPLLFDKIRLFSENTPKLIGQIVFKLDGITYVGAANLVNKTYSFYSFKE